MWLVPQKPKKLMAVSFRVGGRKSPKIRTETRGDLVCHLSFTTPLLLSPPPHAHITRHHHMHTSLTTTTCTHHSPPPHAHITHHHHMHTSLTTTTCTHSLTTTTCTHHSPPPHAHITHHHHMHTFTRWQHPSSSHHHHFHIPTHPLPSPPQVRQVPLHLPHLWAGRPPRCVYAM
jgi:hypothetical protein